MPRDWKTTTKKQHKYIVRNILAINIQTKKKQAYKLKRSNLIAANRRNIWDSYLYYYSLSKNPVSAVSNEPATYRRYVTLLFKLFYCLLNCSLKQVFGVFDKFNFVLYNSYLIDNFWRVLLTNKLVTPGNFLE